VSSEQEEERGSHARCEAHLEPQRRREEERRRGKRISHPLEDSLEVTDFTERRVRRERPLFFCAEKGAKEKRGSTAKRG
jgi:hypothetical protein